MGIILSVNIEYKEEETMDIIKKFGEMVGSTSLKDAKKARKLLLLGYQLQEKRLLLFPDKKLPYSGQYVARIVMQNIIKALSKPEDTAMVSIFVPGELLTAAGLTPYSVEAMSCFIAGTQCEQPFLRKTEEEGFPETMCSYHRVFLGASLTGLVPAPKCMVYTNLAMPSNTILKPNVHSYYDISLSYKIIAARSDDLCCYWSYFLRPDRIVLFQRKSGLQGLLCIHV